MVTVSSTVLDEDQNRVVPFFLVLISFRFHSFDQKATLSRQSMYPTEFEDLTLEHNLKFRTTSTNFGSLGFRK